jgi:hypothetical protein
MVFASNCPKPEAEWLGDEQAEGGKLSAPLTVVNCLPLRPACTGREVTIS